MVISLALLMILAKYCDLIAIRSWYIGVTVPQVKFFEQVLLEPYLKARLLSKKYLQELFTPWQKLIYDGTMIDIFSRV